MERTSVIEAIALAVAIVALVIQQIDWKKEHASDRLIDDLVQLQFDLQL